MVPTPQEETLQCDAKTSPRDAIVISGMSGVYPRANSVKELADILYNKRNPVSEDQCRFVFEHPEVPHAAGTIPGLEVFDSQFFGVHRGLAFVMDPMARKLMEQTYQAIIDAGVNPATLSGKKVGVFVGVPSYSTVEYRFRTNNLTIVGSSKTMFSNRISYWLNVKGPSYSVDAACCGSMVALEMAYQALASGECEAAIVAATKLWFTPAIAITYGSFLSLSPDDKTRSFDENASGFTFSEAVNVLFLQRSKDALRAYAELKHVKCEFGSLAKGEVDLRFGYYREPEKVCNFLRYFYKEAGVSPQHVEYVEAFGSAVPEADKAELEAIDAVYCAGRSRPLPVGCVTSNIGYTEAATGIAAITKVLLGYHTGSLAANLHLDAPRSDVTCLRDGRVTLLRDHRPFRDGYAAVNGMSYTGQNAHVLLYNRYKQKNLQQYKSDIPYLVTISGRHESAVKKVIDELKSSPLDPEQLALLHNLHNTRTTFHLGRGYTILAADSEGQTQCLREQADYYDDARRPLWFVYSGMGSQWAGMGTALMRLPIFAAAIDKCRRMLEPKGIDIIHIITSQDKGIFENILHSFVGIAAIQIGITDVLREIGLVPDKIIGHSVGELGCAYADGCLTAEEMILAAYYRGLVSLETPFIHGAMAAVGVGYQGVLKLCPPDIEVACHNSADSCTISGPADSIRTFVEKMTSEGLFTKEVACSNIAYHSKYIAEAGPGLLKYLREVIKVPKARSERWVSSSVPRRDWGKPDALYGGAEYHTNNLLNPVLFEEASRLIPYNAVLIEIAPHGLLQAILKRALPDSCVNIPLTRRGSKDLVFFLEAIGKIYMQGFVPRVSALYPPVQFPVSSGTPMLSHLVEWAHEEKWSVLHNIRSDARVSKKCNFVVSIHDDDYKYIQGHIFKDRPVYPLSAVLMDVWDTLAMTSKLSKRSFPVEFKDVRVHALPVLHERRQLSLTVKLQGVDGKFEVLDDVSKVASGVIIHNDLIKNLATWTSHGTNVDEFIVTSEDIYQMSFNRDYRYRGEFRSIHSASSCLSKARVLWRNNWVTFVDAVFQLDALRTPQGIASQPAFIKKILVNVSAQRDSPRINLDNEELLTAHVFEEFCRTWCAGVIIEGIKYRDQSTPKTDTVLFDVINLEHKSTEATIEKSFKVSQHRHSAGHIVLLQNGSPSPSWEGGEVTVHYAGVNDLHNQSSTGAVVREDNELTDTRGCDFSGTLKNGERVMGVADMRAGATLRARAQLLWPLPAHWSLQDGATVPRAYCLAYYCLVLKYQVSRGASVYVEDGLGALGQAAISVALALDCDVFTTVGSAQEKRYLMNLFPQIKGNHICGFDEFAIVILDVTNGSGCDVVISSPKGALMTDTLQCVKEFGTTFVTESEMDISFGMVHLFKSRNVVFLKSSLLQNMNKEMLDRLQRLVAEGISRGVVRPLTRLPQQLVRTARRPGGTRIPGSVLLHLHEAPATQRLTCSSEMVHIIVCSNEAYGVLLLEKLVLAGARRLHLHLPKKSNFATETLKIWLQQDVHVHVSSEDLTKQSNVERLLVESSEEAPVEGIHFITLEDPSEQSADDRNETINRLDLTSRKLCADLRYFTVLGEDDAGLSTCASRKQNNLPATMLKISNLNKLQSQDMTSRPAFTRWEAVDALDGALMAQEAALVAKKQVATKHSLLEDVAQMMNVTISPQTPPSSTLESLGLDDSNAQAVTERVQGVHGLALDPHELPTVTVKRLQEIEEIIYNYEFEELKGLDTFFSYVEPDELTAAADMAFPSTLVVKDLSEHEIAWREPHLVVVCGVEGAAARFGRLCAALRLAALVLQPGLARAHETVEEQARRHVHTLNKMGLDGHFYLLGYEAGVEISLEMAALLEERGLTGTVFCVGGGPQSLSVAVEEVAAGFGSEEALQEAVVRHMARLLVGEGAAGAALDRALDEALRDCDTWERRVENGARALRGHTSHTTQYVQHVMRVALARLQRARRPGPHPRALGSRLLALLPAGCAPAARAELQRCSRQPVLECQLRAPLGSAADDLRVAALVNRHLSEDIHERFQSMNRCETYYIAHL